MHLEEKVFGAEEGRGGRRAEEAGIDPPDDFK